MQELYLARMWVCICVSCYKSAPWFFYRDYGTYVLEYNAIAELLGAKIEGLPLRDRAFMAARAFSTEGPWDANIPERIRYKKRVYRDSKKMYLKMNHMLDVAKLMRKKLVNLFEKAYGGTL